MMTVNRFGLEPVVVLLFVGILIFTTVLIGLAFLRPNDGQTFQIVSGLVTAFSGAFFMRINPQQPGIKPPLLDPQNPLGLNKPGAVA